MTLANDTTLDARFTLTVGSPSNPFCLEAQFQLDRGLLVLFGPSGAGKSLTLAALAGHISPQEGLITLAGQPLVDTRRSIHVAARDRRIGLVPQHNSLFPFRDVRGNVTFGLPRDQRRSRNDVVESLMDELGIAHLADARPDALSGGERQRVALARALAVRPQLLLLDEPFASIDDAGRRALQDILQSILKDHGIPAVFVTHDVDEARRMGQQVVLFERGRTTRQGRPRDILGIDRKVSITGQVVEEVEASGADGGDATQTIRLSSATLTGPRDSLEANEQGQLHIQAELPLKG
ncbi:MAG TPA: ABC transporter ATP-binding protein [Deltaproteobacteria bacterium]|nr:ABC transporter ATP-binding protein [Deltaproteobacteria bacterium]HCP47919.1 ABC transporter ATP-binding protein [Deltaproteobacteria bacterium]